MPIYPYRCDSNHSVEKFFSMGKQEKEVVCSCGLIAKRVFTVPQISVDNTDKIDYTVSAGRNFSNRRELQAWMKEKNVHVSTDADWAQEKYELEAKQAFHQELAAKGIDYREYLEDKRQSEIRDQDEMMRKLGVKVEQVEASDYLGATASQGWVDTVEDSYLGDKTSATTTNCESYSFNKSGERVECPYSELTNGAVSNL